MKAVIFCDNNENALMPITGTMPKFMIPICGRIAIHYVLDSINNYDITHAYIVSDYNQDALNSIFKSDKFKNLTISLLTSDKLANFNFDDDIVFISDIMLFNFNLFDALNHQAYKKPFATIITKTVDVSQSKDLLLVNNDGQVESMLSKQSNNRFYSNLANTGVWIIPSQNTIPFFQIYTTKHRISAKDFTISAFNDKGYWCSIHNVKELLKCQRDVLTSKASFEFGGHKMLSGIVSPDLFEFSSDIQINPPAYIGKNVSIGSGSVIDNCTIIGDNVTIGKNVKLYGAIIMSGAYIGDRVECTNCIICRNATLLNSSIINEHCIIGESAIIGENAIVEDSVRVWNNKKIERNIVVSFDIRYGNMQALHISEDGIYGETNGEISAYTAIKTGLSLVNAGRNVAVGYKSNSKTSHCIATAICSGIASAGGNAMLLGECIESELAFLTTECKQDLGVYVESDSITKIKFISKDGLTLDRLSESSIEAGLSGNTVLRASYDNFGEIYDAQQMRKLYEIELVNRIPNNLNMNIGISTSNKYIKSLFERLVKANPDSNNKIVFQISSDGKKASAFSEETGFVFYEKLVAICCQNLFEHGQDVALPYSFSQTIDEIAKQYGRKVYRFYDCPDNSSDNGARKLASKLKFPHDGIILALDIIKILTDRNVEFKDAVESLPQTFSSSRSISCKNQNLDFIKDFSDSCDFEHEGVWVKGETGEVFIRPSRTGKSIFLYAESFSSETASELCSSYEEIIKSKLNG